MVTRTSLLETGENQTCTHGGETPENTQDIIMLCNHRCNMSSLPECGLYTGIFALCLNSGPHAAALPLTADYVTESLARVWDRDTALLSKYVPLPIFSHAIL